MGFMAALPWIIKGGSALVGGLISKHSEKNAAKRSAEEQQALQGGQGAAGELGQVGQVAASRLGLPAAKKALSYYQTLLGGNRAQMAQATAAPRAAIQDTYRGVQTSLDHSGIRGASRLRANEEVARDEAGKVAGLTTGVQPAAAAAMGDLGQNLTNTGSYATNASGGIYDSLLGRGAANRAYGRQEGAQTGKEVGSLIFDVLSGTVGQKKPSYIADDVSGVSNSIYDSWAPPKTGVMY
jgi:hypothetical protein